MVLWLWILAAILVFVIVFVLMYNTLITLKSRIDNAWAQIDVQLKRRADLIPNLVETVKGYAKHERSEKEGSTNGGRGENLGRGRR